MRGLSRPYFWLASAICWGGDFSVRNGLPGMVFIRKKVIVMIRATVATAAARRLRI